MSDPTPLRGRRRPKDPPDPDAVIGVEVADLHWSHRAPAFRSNEPDWYGAQERAWEQVNILSEEHKCPIFIAGDLFSTWREPHQLITWAMKMLRRPTFAVPGNHDLPTHSYEEMHRSAYGVLVESGKLTNIPPDQPLPLKGLVLHGFPCGFPLEPWEGGSVSPFGIRLAVVHDYIWVKHHGYEGAPEEARLRAWEPRLRGYDAVLFGDNHDGFMSAGSGDAPCHVLNAGCLMRRRADERDYRPAIGLLYGDGHVERHFLDTSEDKCLTPEELVSKMREDVEGFGEFLKGLDALGASALDFAAVVAESLRSDPPAEAVRAIMANILDRVSEGRK